jgi:hypothetical protein
LRLNRKSQRGYIADGVNASLLNAPLLALQPKLVFAIEPIDDQPQIFRINSTFIIQALQ